MSSGAWVKNVTLAPLYSKILNKIIPTIVILFLHICDPISTFLHLPRSSYNLYNPFLTRVLMQCYISTHIFVRPSYRLLNVTNDCYSICTYL